ncbi:MAG: nucleotidyltransferase domain-containing protein [Bacilli bacterium]|jgi:predicted nucleotidyltransferase|nr:nucleotidyltransferase domain-containing protein [Bacilli bacterium]
MDLKELRKTKRLTQVDAASIAGVSVESYKNHELGRSRGDSPLGRMIFDKLSAYEPYGFEKGILPLDLIKQTLSDVLGSKPVDFAYLFGSYAKGEADAKSDVDIMVSGAITGLEFFSLGGELERALHKNVDIIRLSDVGANQDLIREIMATGIRIYEKK